MEYKKGKVIHRLAQILLKQRKITFAYLHGSFLSEERFEDVDIGLYLDEEDLRETEAVNFEIKYSLELEKIIRIPVDVKILNYAPLSFRYQVTCGYLLFSRDEAKREEFLCRTWSEYFDFQPLSRIYLKELLSG